MELGSLRKDINKQKYLNMLIEMEKTSKFGGTAIVSQFSVTRNVLDTLKELKCIERVPGKGASHQYVWITSKPTMTLAEQVIKDVNDKIKSYTKGATPKVISKVIPKSQIAYEKKEVTFVLTDEMCIAHLKKSKDILYEIYRTVREKL
jgi:hypothetical protein